MFFDVFDPVFAISQPLGRIRLAKPLNDIDGRLGDVPREMDLVDASQNDVVKLQVIARHRKRRPEK